MESEVALIKKRYERRKLLNEEAIYSLLLPYRCKALQQKERALIDWIKNHGIRPIENQRALEIGCGNGDNLLQLIRLGFQPENLVGNELLEDRASTARKRLPVSTEIILGDASELELDDHSFDVVFQSTVFTSILDDHFQAKLANRMWRLTKPGGGILWYDFIYNNPKNPDVKGVPVKRIAQLFPHGKISTRRITLAPPIARAVTYIYPHLYDVFHLFPLFRTHVLCWIQK